MNATSEQDDLSYGDPRRCPAHGIVTSSPDGMFDAPCGACEAGLPAGAPTERPAPPPPPAELPF